MRRRQRRVINSGQHVFLFIWTACGFLFSCEPDNSHLSDRRVVVEADLYHDSIPRWIYISLSQPISADTYESINDAEVRLYEDEVLVDRLVPVFWNELRNFYYEGSHITRRGHQYRLEVDVQGYPAVSAETEIPETVRFEIVDIQDASYGMLLPEGFVTRNDAWLVKIALHDPPGDNFYRLQFSHYKLGEDDRIWLMRLSPQLDMVFDRYLRTFDKEWIVMDLFNDQTFKETTNIINYYVTYHPWGIPDTVGLRFSLYSMSREAYQFERTLQLQRDLSDDMFSEPVQVYNNIRNGLGYFYGISVYQAEVIAEFATRKFTVKYTDR